MYTLECCPNCDKLKGFLAAQGIRYLERDLSTAESLTELRLNGIFVNEAPVLQHGENFLTTAELFSSGNVNEAEIRKLAEGA